MKRTLTLKPEPLTALTTDELRDVAGGVPPTRDCPSANPVCMLSNAFCDVIRTILP